MQWLSKNPSHLSKHISVIGCGWLGLPLSKQLIEKGHSVKGSSTSADKLDLLKSSGIDPYYIEMSEDGIKGDITACLLGSEILILNIPPGLRKQPSKDFVKQMSHLTPYIEESTITKVLFISSTSVYADDASIPVITEDSTLDADSASGKQLLEVERGFQNHQGFHTTILRFAGLFGDDRHPATVLSGKTNLKNPEAPVNLIHLKDCIQIISKIVHNEIWDNTFNASTTPHPSKQDYYRAVCKEMHLPLPEFDSSSPSKGKCIDSNKLVQLLNYEFQVKLNN